MGLGRSQLDYDRGGAGAGVGHGNVPLDAIMGKHDARGVGRGGGPADRNRDPFRIPLSRSLRSLRERPSEHPRWQGRDTRGGGDDGRDAADVDPKSKAEDPVDAARSGGVDPGARERVGEGSPRNTSTAVGGEMADDGGKHVLQEKTRGEGERDTVLQGNAQAVGHEEADGKHGLRSEMGISRDSQLLVSRWFASGLVKKWSVQMIRAFAVSEIVSRL